jgi:hypothetical protein
MFPPKLSSHALNGMAGGRAAAVRPLFGAAGGKGGGRNMVLPAAVQQSMRSLEHTLAVTQADIARWVNDGRA